MKKVLSLLLCLGLGFSLFGCGSNKSNFDKLKEISEYNENGKSFDFSDSGSAGIYYKDETIDGSNYIIVSQSNENDFVYVYMPSSNVIKFEYEFENELIPLEIDYSNEEVFFDFDDDEVSYYYFCESISDEECMEKLFDEFSIDESAIKEGVTSLKEIEKKLKSENLTFESINVPFNELEGEKKKGNGNEKPEGMSTETYNTGKKKLKQ